MKRGVIAIFSTLIVFFMIIGMGSASADISVTGTKVVNSGQALYFTIYMATAGPLPFTVDVYSGPNIDIILVDGANLQLFLNGQSYTYYTGGTFYNSNHAVGNAWLDAGTYYLIFNNNYQLIGGGPATVHYSYTPTSFGNWSTNLGLILLMILLLVVFAGIGLFIAFRRGKAGSENKATEQARPTAPDASPPNAVGNGSRFCRYCGRGIGGGGPFCPSCGRRSD